MNTTHEILFVNRKRMCYNPKREKRIAIGVRISWLFYWKRNYDYRIMNLFNIKNLD